MDNLASGSGGKDDNQQVGGTLEVKENRAPNRFAKEKDKAYVDHVMQTNILIIGNGEFPSQFKAGLISLLKDVPPENILIMPECFLEAVDNLIEVIKTKNIAMILLLKDFLHTDCSPESLVKQVTEFAKLRKDSCHLEILLCRKVASHPNFPNNNFLKNLERMTNLHIGPVFVDDPVSVKSELKFIALEFCAKRNPVL